MIVKHFFKQLFGFIPLTIQSGPLSGKRWSLTSGGNFIRGNYESYKTEAILKNFVKGDIFLDIGAHFGYFSAIAATINGYTGKVFAFEPRPMNIQFFKRHMRLNNWNNVVLFETAVGDEEKMVLFDSRHGSATGKVSEKGNLLVRQVSIDKMYERGDVPLPTFIKIDVEGGEIEVLKGLVNVISAGRPKIIVATHNDVCHNFVTNFLKNKNYRFEILNPERRKGDTEIIALPE